MAYIRSSNHNTVSEKSRIAPVPGRTSLHSQTKFVSRRMRINRIFLYKRRIERRRSSIPPQVLILLITLCTVLAILVSGTVGGAYAYYRSQLPLLNGIAQHSLFQTTHIYDRNGKLLYELYEKQKGKGRRTYINYQDISP